MQRSCKSGIATIAAVAALSSYSLAQEVTTLSTDELVDPPQELAGARVKVDGGRVFAASPRSAVLKIDDVYVPLSFDDSGENAFPWQDCRGLEPIDECRMSVTGIFVVHPDRARPELHDVVAER